MTEQEMPRWAIGDASRWLRGIGTVLLVLLLAYATLYWFLRNPSLFGPSVISTGPVGVDPVRLEFHVATLAAVKPSRSLLNPAALMLTADHIEAVFAQTGCEVQRHVFGYRGKEHKNIICAFGPPDAELVLLGAHYDVYQRSPDTQTDSGAKPMPRMPGADDNASGVAAILEIARLVGRDKPTLPHRLELVAFTLEEFVEPNAAGVPVSIGSHRYALRLKEEGARVKLMVSVEMIGYFDDRPGSQRFPAPLSPILSLFYPTTGNFIGVIGRSFDRSLVARVRQQMQISDTLPVYSINAPTFVPGIDRSDHKNFWAEGYPAVMVTDTAEFRNSNYHTSQDTPDTLDYERMAEVVEGLYQLAIKF